MEVRVFCSEKNALEEGRRKKRESQRTYRAKNREHVREKESEYNKKHSKEHVLAVDAWRRDNPEKIEAHGVLHYAIKKGMIKKPSACTVCGGTYCVVAHHPDYGEPLSVIWLCSLCHVRVHNKRGQEGG